MKNKAIFYVFLALFSGFNVSGQADTIVCYDFDTKTTTLILPGLFDKTLTFAKTSSYVGGLGNKVDLALTPPVSNLFQGSSFSMPVPAAEFFDISSYPARAAIRQGGYKDGEKAYSCSGMMVGPCLVLTAAHCIYMNSDNIKTWFYDSMFVSPAYNNALAPYGSVGVKKAYIFKKFYDKKGWEDVALLELKSAIGYGIGWIGMAFSSNPAYFTGKVFHKFSYPAAEDMFNPGRIYSGDTMYYNYGSISVLGAGPSIGVNSQDASGVQGQSGSSLFYTDNNTEYYSFGVFNFSLNYMHYQLNRNSFHQFKNIIDNYITAVNENKAEELKVSLFPNPSASLVTIEVPEDSELILTDVSGKTIGNSLLQKGYNTLNVQELEAGIYFAHIRHKELSKTLRLVKVN